MIVSPRLDWASFFLDTLFYVEHAFRCSRLFEESYKLGSDREMCDYRYRLALVLNLGFEPVR